MSDKDTLCLYRLKQAEETLSDAEKMISAGLSSRSITNRAYYSMFYAVLSLFLKSEVNIKTSKHSGVISIFDREFIKTGRLDKRYSEMLHDIFDARQEGDYKDLMEVAPQDAKEHVRQAKEFIEGIKNYMARTSL